MLKISLLVLALFAVSVQAQTLPDRPTEVLRQLEVSWIPPTTRANPDGSPGPALAPNEIGGYEIYAYKDGELEEPIEYRIDDGAAVNYLITDLPAGSYRFAMRVFDTAGLYSDPTPFVDAEVDLRTGPSAPSFNVNSVNPLTDAVAWCVGNKNCNYELKFKVAGVD